MYMFDMKIKQLNFTSSGSGFFIELEDSYSNQFCHFKCKSNDTQKEIQIGECTISFSKESKYSNHSIGYKYILNPTLGYQLPKHVISFDMTGKEDKLLKLTLDKLNINFQYSAQVCKEPLPEGQSQISVLARFNSTDEIHFCKLNETKLTTGSVTSVSPNMNGKVSTTQSSTTEKILQSNSMEPKYSHTSVTPLETDENITNVTDPSHRMHKQGQSSTSTILIVLSFLTVTMSFLVYFIIARRNKSKENPNAWDTESIYQ
ncbi:hypothetical protein RF11_04384 [Thelohanellus kitauei]|uniref:Uncharacterized protein n=1 Tax=Thelohanellus kitauei TaxID=669202 RepID=A0A0C2MF41_THEKT|nr:hypothetical protein RF11_04384 [Thelohanellus kitauei]